MVTRRVEKLTHYQTSMTFTAELHPTSYRKSIHLSHISSASYCEKLYRRITDTHKVPTHRLFFLLLSWFIFIEVSLGKRSYGRSFTLSSTNIIELGWGWGILWSPAPPPSLSEKTRWAGQPQGQPPSTSLSLYCCLGIQSPQSPMPMLLHGRCLRWWAQGCWVQ